MVLFKLIGILGLLLISMGVLARKRLAQEPYFIFGGIALLAYSISIKDWVFIILQMVFILASVYELLKLERWMNKRRKK